MLSMNYTVSTQYWVLTWHSVHFFPDILRLARSVYQTQTVWDGSLDTIKVEKVSVMYGTILGIVRY